VSDEKLWDESPTSRHLQVLYHQTSFQIFVSLVHRENHESRAWSVGSLKDCRKHKLLTVINDELQQPLLIKKQVRISSQNVNAICYFVENVLQ